MVEQKLAPLNFPCLVAKGGPKALLISAEKKDFVRFNLKARLRNNRYLLKNGSSPRMKIHWILDKEAKFRNVTYLNTKRTFLRRLAWFWDFTLAECEIDSGTQLTVRELLARCEKLTSPPGFPTAGHLKGFLRKSDQDTIFDSEMFRTFWDRHCPRLPQSAWEESI